MNATVEATFFDPSRSDSLESRFGSLIKRIVLSFYGKIQTRSPSGILTLFIRSTNHIRSASLDVNLIPSVTKPAVTVRSSYPFNGYFPDTWIINQNASSINIIEARVPKIGPLNAGNAFCHIVKIYLEVVLQDELCYRLWKVCKRPQPLSQSLPHLHLLAQLLLSTFMKRPSGFLVYARVSIENLEKNK